jgi:hypothetical protein
MRCFLERPGTIAKDCESLNIGQYAPVGAIETLTPKSGLGFRIAHQLTAADNVIYLAALLDCAPNLEAARLPKDDNEAAAVDDLRRPFARPPGRTRSIFRTRTRSPWNLPADAIFNLEESRT